MEYLIPFSSSRDLNERQAAYNFISLCLDHLPSILGSGSILDVDLVWIYGEDHEEFTWHLILPCDKAVTLFRSLCKSNCVPNHEWIYLGYIKYKMSQSSQPMTDEQIGKVITEDPDTGLTFIGFISWESIVNIDIPCFWREWLKSDATWNERRIPDVDQFIRNRDHVSIKKIIDYDRELLETHYYRDLSEAILLSAIKFCDIEAFDIAYEFFNPYRAIDHVCHCIKMSFQHGLNKISERTDINPDPELIFIAYLSVYNPEKIDEYFNMIPYCDIRKYLKHAVPNTHFIKLLISRYVQSSEPIDITPIIVEFFKIGKDKSASQEIINDFQELLEMSNITYNREVITKSVTTPFVDICSKMKIIDEKIPPLARGKICRPISGRKTATSSLNVMPLHINGDVVKDHYVDSESFVFLIKPIGSDSWKTMQTVVGVFRDNAIQPLSDEDKERCKVRNLKYSD